MAFFFAWLGFYTRMLIPAALIGLLVTFYGVVSVFGFGDSFTYGVMAKAILNQRATYACIYSLQYCLADLIQY